MLIIKLLDKDRKVIAQIAADNHWRMVNSNGRLGIVNAYRVTLIPFAEVLPKWIVFELEGATKQGQVNVNSIADQYTFEPGTLALTFNAEA